MAPHTTDTTHEKASTDTLPSGHAGRRRLLIALTVLAFLAIGAVALFALSLIEGAVILLMLSALLAYLIYPLVQFLQRRLPPPLAIAVAYLLVAGVLAVVMFIVTSSLIRQSSALAQYIQFLFSPAGERQLQSLIGALGTSVGLALLHVPYAALLGTLFFFLFFVPVIGSVVITALSILAALPQGWVVMLIVAVYMTFLQGIVLGQILGPRIFSKTVGVHPIVALFALFAGAELFGLLGGFLAIPVAGVFQQIIVALWHRWKDEHPDQFPPEELPLRQSAVLPEQQVTPIDIPTPGISPGH